MNILVFGATGRVGMCFVEQAFEAGHRVTTFVRDARRLIKVGADRVGIVQGDVLDRDAVRSALEPGFDAVVSAIGENALKPSTLITEGVGTIIAGMKANGVKRFLGVSGTAEMPNQTFFGRQCTAILRMTPVGHAARDHDGAVEKLKSSDLKWVLAGCPYIKDGPRRGRYRRSLVFPGGFKIIHPPDVADFLVQELTENQFSGDVVGIWY